MWIVLCRDAWKFVKKFVTHYATRIILQSRDGTTPTTPLLRSKMLATPVYGANAVIHRQQWAAFKELKGRNSRQVADAVLLIDGTGPAVIVAILPRAYLLAHVTYPIGHRRRCTGNQSGEWRRSSETSARARRRRYTWRHQWRHIGEWSCHIAAASTSEWLIRFPCVAASLDR